jgi:GAF domain-containing protein
MDRDDSAESRQKAEEKRDFLDTVGRHQEKQFDELAELAAAVCWTPISQVNLLDEQFEYCKGAVGLQEKRVVQENSFCREAMRRDGEIFIVSDATANPQFGANPFVTGETGLRFYAGVPVYSPGGEKVGVLCVNRVLKPWQIRSVRLVAQQVNARLELKMCRKAAEQRGCGEQREPQY